jgi:hypothetical protein
MFSLTKAVGCVLHERIERLFSSRRARRFTQEVNCVRHLSLCFPSQREQLFVIKSIAQDKISLFADDAEDAELEEKGEQGKFADESHAEDPQEVPTVLEIEAPPVVQVEGNVI